MRVCAVRARPCFYAGVCARVLRWLLAGEFPVAGEGEVDWLGCLGARLTAGSDWTLAALV